MSATIFNIQKLYILSTYWIFMFLWFSEKVIIIVASIICDFIAETSCVYCAVRTESLTIIQVNFRLFSPTAQAISRRPVTAEARLWFRVRPREICGGQNDNGTGFSPISNISARSPYLSSSTRCCYQMDKGRSLGTFHKSMLFENRWALVRKEL